METYEAIITRRSVPKTAPGRVPTRADIERLLEAGIRAPTHHLTQPWRFVVLTGEALDDFGQAWATGDERLGKDTSGIPDKVRRAPVIICVIEKPHVHNRKVIEIEEHHATGMAIQNILLAAHDLGLGAMIRTGPAARLPEVERYLGLEEGELVAGFIYVGYPAEETAERPMTRRSPIAERTEWRGWT